jgi:hypothetical protein
MGRLMLDTFETYWKVREYTNEAKGIAYDTCHKIYILMDDDQVNLMREYGYGDENDPDSLITSDQLDPAEMATVAVRWFEDSCGLKFINAVYSDKSIGHEGFVDVVSQFEDIEDDWDDDEDEEDL